MKFSNVLISGFAVLTLGVLAQPSQAAPIVSFNFTGLCDDCAGPEDAELEPGTNLDDGIYQEVSGELVMFNYTPGDALGGGRVALDPPPATAEAQEQEEQAVKTKQEADGKLKKGQKKKKRRDYFTYDGSSLNDPFTIFLDTATVSGQIFADGSLGEDLRIRTKGLSILIGIEGDWSIVFGRDKQQKQPMKKAKELDVGVGAALTTVVPAPGALALLGFGLLGLGAARRRTH